MILSGHQPVYLPSILLLNKIALSDLFMWVGHVQFSPKSWQQRNRINLNGEELFLTVPVKKAGHFGQTINEVEIDGDSWKRKHLGSIRQAYQRAPFFDLYFAKLEEILERPWTRLEALNRETTETFMRWLGIATPVTDSRSHPAIQGHKTDMLIEMCQAVGATEYLSNEGARDYVDEALMARHGLGHRWQVFSHPLYQPKRRRGDYLADGPFLENMSCLDILFNLGEAAGDIVKTCGRRGECSLSTDI